jgi:hypothetical protein
MARFEIDDESEILFWESVKLEIHPLVLGSDRPELVCNFFAACIF